MYIENFYNNLYNYTNNFSLILLSYIKKRRLSILTFAILKKIFFSNPLLIQNAMGRLLARTCHSQEPLNTDRWSLLVSLPSIFSISLQLPSFAPIKLNCTPNLMLLVDAIKRLMLRSVLLKLCRLYIAKMM